MSVSGHGADTSPRGARDDACPALVDATDAAAENGHQAEPVGERAGSDNTRASEGGDSVEDDASIGGDAVVLAGADSGDDGAAMPAAGTGDAAPRAVIGSAEIDTEAGGVTDDGAGSVPDEEAASDGGSNNARAAVDVDASVSAEPAAREAEPTCSCRRRPDDAAAMDSPAFRRVALRRVALLGFLHVMAWAATLPALAPMLLDMLHCDPVEAARWAALLQAFTSVVEFIAQAFVGAVTDAEGRRRFLLFGLACSTLSYCCYATLPSVGWLAAISVLRGMVTTSTTIVYAMIVDCSRQEEAGIAPAAAKSRQTATSGTHGDDQVPEADSRDLGAVETSVEAGSARNLASTEVAENMGAFLALAALGLLLGPVVGGVAGFVSVRAPFVAAAALQGLSVLLATTCVPAPETLPPQVRVPFSWAAVNPLRLLSMLYHTPGMRRLLYIFVTSNLGFTVYSVGAVYTAARFGWQAIDIGGFLAFAGLVAIVSQGLVTRILIPKWGEEKALVVGLATAVVHFTMLGAATEGWHFYVIVALTPLAWLTFPSVRGLMPREFPLEAQGRLQGAVGSANTVTAALGPLLAAAIYAWSVDSAGLRAVEDDAAFGGGSCVTAEASSPEDPVGGPWAGQDVDPIVGSVFWMGTACSVLAIPMAWHIRRRHVSQATSTRRSAAREAAADAAPAAVAMTKVSVGDGVSSAPAGIGVP